MISLNEQCNSLAAQRAAAVVSIPQPSHVRSAQHNLQSVEHYVPLMVVDEDARSLRCEHFRRYGENGHELTYLRGNDNIPGIVKSGVLPAVEKLVAPVRDLGKALNWKLTLNIYRVLAPLLNPSLSPSLAGFPFHVDIPANGVVTMIFSLIQGAELQLVKEDDVALGDVRSVFMEANSLLVLSGESRYQWRHRVLPSPSKSSAQGEVGRISIVLGCQ